MSRLAWTMAVAAAALSAVGCGEEEKPEPVPRTGTIINVPLEASFAEAVAMADVNDTIYLAAPALLDTTVVIRSEQTPLVITGGKLASVVAPESHRTALVFKQPQAGTTIDGLLFRTADGTRQGVAIAVQGGGGLVVEQCAFQNFEVQILMTGGTLELRGSLLVNPAAFSVETTSGARVTATGNTLVGAGDCGILLGSGSTLTAQNNLIAGYENYGIACTGGSGLRSASGCNNLFDAGSGGLPYLQCTADSTDTFVDPLFCDPDHGDYTLAQDSPCLNKESCGAVGALGVGCPAGN